MNKIKRESLTGKTIKTQYGRLTFNEKKCCVKARKDERAKVETERKKDMEKAYDEWMKPEFVKQRKQIQKVLRDPEIILLGKEIAEKIRAKVDIEYERKQERKTMIETILNKWGNPDRDFFIVSRKELEKLKSKGNSENTLVSGNKVKSENQSKGSKT